MADLMQFDLVSPERSLASLQANEVQIPGAEGDFTAMALHAPVITTLRPGVLTVVAPEGTSTYLVTGGFAEVGAAGTSVLAERAYRKEDVTSELMDELIADAKAKSEKAASDEASKYVEDLIAAGTHLRG